MARVNITVPDPLLAKARAAGINVSRASAAALADELDRREKAAELDRYLQALDAELGPGDEKGRAAAEEWVDQLLNAAAATERAAESARSA
jgi:post-segregation antitoxin (ccd killing protein)